MALDIYVMPLWRFKAGIFTSPVEELFGTESVTVSPTRVPPPKHPWHLRLLVWLGVIQFVEPEPPECPSEKYRQANAATDALKAELTRLAGQPIDWQDVGEKVYGRQFHGQDFFKAFAAWCDHRESMPEFPRIPEANYYKHPIWQLPTPAQRRFPTLVKHSLCTGYFFPIDFEGLYQVEPFKVSEHLEFYHDVASTQAVLRELEDLLELLRTLPAKEPAQNAYRTYEEVAQAQAEQLREICRLSLEHQLPVIFYG